MGLPPAERKRFALIPARRLSSGYLGSNEGALLTPSRDSNQRHVLERRVAILNWEYRRCCNLALEEIAPEDKNRDRGSGARVVLYIAASLGEMAHGTLWLPGIIVKEWIRGNLSGITAGCWISLVYAVRPPKALRTQKLFCSRRRRLAQGCHDPLSTFPVMRASRPHGLGERAPSESIDLD